MSQMLYTDLIEIISEKNMLQKKYLRSALQNLTINELSDLEATISFFCTQKFSLQAQADAYLLLVSDTIKEQAYFFEHHDYRYHTFAEVAEDVYYNQSYMTNYMIGVTLSIYIWSNHLAITRWFEKKINGISGNRYLEVGPGFGHYFLKAMNKTNIKCYEAVDISPTSTEGTKKYIEYFSTHATNSPLMSSKSNLNKTYQVNNMDFMLLEENEKFDAFVMGEVLEHVEHPLAFLKKIRRITNPNSFIYITTAINAPVIDHIMLFRNKEEIFNLINNADMKVKDFFCIAGNGISLDKAVQKNYPISIALVLEHLN